MVDALQRAHSEQANPRQFEASDLREPTLADSDNWYPIFEAQGDSTTAYGAGHGVRNADLNRDGWSDLNLQNGGGAAISGSVRFRIYRDSSKEDLIAQSGTYSLNSLRSAESEARTDKVLIAAMYSVLAGMDSYLTVEVSPTPSSEGDAVSKANSSTDHGLAYGEVPT